MRQTSASVLRKLAVSKTSPYLLSPLCSKDVRTGRSPPQLRRGGLCFLVLGVVSQVRRTSLPRTPVNKGKKKGVEQLRPHPFQPLTP